MINVTTKRDKEILNKLVSLPVNDSNIGDLLSSCILKNRTIIIYPENLEVQLFTEKDRDIWEFIDDLLNFISLFESLKEQKLLFVHVDPRIKISDTKASRKKITASALSNITDFEKRINKDPEQFNVTKLNTVYDFFSDYISSFVYVRSELRDYVDNDFMSLEERWYKKTIFWTQVAAVVAMIGLIYSFLK